MSDLTVFNFSENNIRIVVSPDGDPWFVASDVCEALTISNHRDAVAKLDDDEKHAVGIPDAMGREQVTTAINESGLYSLILTSRKPEAKKFKKWVTSEVLPSIRKTGSYALPKNYSEALKLAYEQSLVIEDQNKRLIEKDSLIVASNEASIKAGEILVREFVKSVDIIDIGEKQFYQWMRDQNIIMESREPYQQYVNRGFFTWKPTEVEHGGKYRYTLRVTPRGKVWLSAKYLAWLDRDMGDAA